MLPVDFAVNSFIVAAAFVGRNKCNDCPVYNCTTSSDAPITWHDFLEVGKKVNLLRKSKYGHSIIVSFPIQGLRRISIGENSLVSWW